MFIVVLRSWRCLKSFQEGVASFSLSMGPWRATGTWFVAEIMILEVYARKRSLVQEEDLLLVQEEDLLIVQEEENVILAQEEYLLVVRH